MRKLASIQYIHSIEPIEGADKIELAHVLGWQCVVQKGTFKTGDLGVYFEVDSFLPMDKRFGFLNGNSYRKSDILGEGYKIRTLTMRGKLSQGLLMPLSEFPEITENLKSPGTDVTNLLRVRKWEIEERASASGTIIGELPPEVPKTDEVRIQSEPDLLKEFKNVPYYITTKMDGSSHSISIDRGGNFHVTGHRYEYKDDKKSDFYEFVKAHDFEEKLRKVYEYFGIRDIVVQGEFCAPGIQGNRLKLKKPDWFIFNVIIDGCRGSFAEIMIVSNCIGAEMVPIEEFGLDFTEKYQSIDDVLDRADKSIYTVGTQNAKAEGIVVRPIYPVQSKIIGSYLSMKVVSNKYLLKIKE